MVKKQNATTEDIERLEQLLKTENELCKKACLEQSAAGSAKASKDIADVRAFVEKQLDQRAAEASRQLEAQKVVEELARCCQEEIKTVKASLEQRLEQSFEAVNAKLEVVEVRIREVDSKLERLGVDVSTRGDTDHAAFAARFQRQDEARDSLEQSLRLELDARFREACEASSGGLAKAEAGRRQLADESQARVDELERDLRAQLGLVEERCKEADASLLQMQETSASQISANVERHERRIHNSEVMAHSLTSMVSEVANIPTRRVEWSLQNIARWLVNEGAKDGSQRAAPLLKWTSPEFEAAGVHGLRFEFKHLEPQDAEGGDCELSLMAGEGLSLMFRLYVGGGGTGVAAQLHHDFDGREPCCARPVCRLAEQISPEDGSLLVGLEILEAVIKVSAPFSSSEGSIETASAMTSRRSSEDDVGDRGVEQLAFSTVAHRYLNHRMLELVQNQVDFMRSRMVRRIEWRIGQASMLRTRFPVGQSICSPHFGAAGVHGLQFVFYPSGYDSAKEGYCSLFIQVPEGCRLKCNLSAGRLHREARLCFDHQGLLGRTNFGRFEHCVDHEDDLVLLALEIEQAQQNEQVAAQVAECHNLGMSLSPSEVSVARELPAVSQRPQTSGTHPSMPRSARSQNAFEASAASLPFEAGAEGGPQASGTVGGVVTLQRSPGQLALEETKQLPSIWTSKPQGNITDQLEGFHLFSALAGPRRPMTGGLGMPAASAAVEPGAMLMQTPRGPLKALRGAPVQRYHMYAA